jgi:hypothetical protein
VQRLGDTFGLFRLWNRATLVDILLHGMPLWGAMNIRRKEFIAEIRRLKRELAEVSGRLTELEEFANPTQAMATSATIVPKDNPFDEEENSFAAKVASGLSKVRLNKWLSTGRLAISCDLPIRRISIRTFRRLRTSKPNILFQFGPGRTSTPRVGMMPMLKPHPNTH